MCSSLLHRFASASPLHSSSNGSPSDYFLLLLLLYNKFISSDCFLLLLLLCNNDSLSATTPLSAMIYDSYCFFVTLIFYLTISVLLLA
jgi:hypothetical protein